MKSYIKPLAIATGICLIGAVLQLTFFAVVLALVVCGLILAWKSGILCKSNSADNSVPDTNAIKRLRIKLGWKHFNIFVVSVAVIILMVAFTITNASQQQSMSYGQTQRDFQNIFDEIRK